MEIDKAEAGDIKLETNLYIIAIRFERGITPSDNGAKETQQAVKRAIKA